MARDLPMSISGTRSMKTHILSSHIHTEVTLLVITRFQLN